MFEDDIFGALKKCAIGLETNEIVEEFDAKDGELRLVKRKVTKRDIPPDIKAVKMLMEEGGIEGLSVEELEEERQNLLNLLKKEEGN